MNNFPKQHLEVSALSPNVQSSRIVVLPSNSIISSVSSDQVSTAYEGAEFEISKHDMNQNVSKSRYCAENSSSLARFSFQTDDSNKWEQVTPDLV
ncbi:hypothetical protein C5167_022054 [Papaver somniferum]|uniref:Uncharacterized protein n=1 Tax=Papaver somniferum TaxID=3469 RepID=A0A4Y7JGQ5_PAPSO|nr:hypothetical protein C5167_022054 [Papaver somniferum]